MVLINLFQQEKLLHSNNELSSGRTVGLFEFATKAFSTLETWELEGADLDRSRSAPSS